MRKFYRFDAVGAAPFGFKGAGFPMRHSLTRHSGKGDLHFITFSCYQRRPLLGRPDASDVFVQILDEVRSRHEFLVLGYVVMPEHVHLLVGEPGTLTPSKVLQVLKHKVSKAMKVEGKTPNFWQRRF